MNDPFFRPINPPARRAGLALFILGGIALVLGAGLTFFSRHLSELEKDPAVHARLDELRRQLPVDLAIALLTNGLMLIAYAVIALTLGLLVRGGRRVPLIITLAAASLVAVLAALAATVSLAHGDANGLMVPLIAVGLHASLIKWAIDALRIVSVGPAFEVVPRRPMEEYYLPPVQPAESVR